MDDLPRRTVLAGSILPFLPAVLCRNPERLDQMPNILQTQVPNGTAALVWNGRQSNVNSLLFINQDLNNYVYLGNQSNITPTSPNVIPVAPNGTFSGDPSEPWYVSGAVSGIQALVTVPNGQNYFAALTQGLGNLVIPSVQSPNFVNNVSGWQISKNGNAQFNNLVIRGTFYGTDFIISASGAFFYSGTPALGNLIVSLAPAATVDSFGNVVAKGINSYQKVGSDYYAVGLNQVNGAGFPGMSVEDVTNAPYSPAGVFAAAGNGTPAIATAALTSGQITSADVAAIIDVLSALDSSVTNGKTLIEAGIVALGVNATAWVDDNHGIIYLLNPVTPSGTPTGGGIYANANSTPSALLPSGFTGTLPVSQTDPTVTTVTAATYSALSKIWSIPDGDPQDGTMYRLTVEGEGIWGTTQETLDFRIAAFGTTFAAVGIALGQFPVSTAFNFSLTASILVKTNGASGEVQGAVIRGQLSAQGVNQEGGTGAQGSVPFTGWTGLTSGIDTLTNNTMTVQAQWGSSTVSCSIESSYSTLERLGP